MPVTNNKPDHKKKYCVKQYYAYELPKKYYFNSNSSNSEAFATELPETIGKMVMCLLIVVCGPGTNECMTF